MEHRWYLGSQKEPLCSGLKMKPLLGSVKSVNENVDERFFRQQTFFP